MHSHVVRRGVIEPVALLQQQHLPLCAVTDHDDVDTRSSAWMMRTCGAAARKWPTSSSAISATSRHRAAAPGDDRRRALHPNREVGLWIQRGIAASPLA